jgi:putative cardiolipin synthase
VAESLTLHTKGMIIDRSITFIGSLNLDPRSIELNSEMGILIPNETMASSMATLVLQRLVEYTYRVDLDERGKLQWRATIDGMEVVEKSEPLVSGFTKFKVFMLKIVPESQL